jgi:hypothetical protein
MRPVQLWIAALMTLPVSGAEHGFNFSDWPQDQAPPGFRSLVFGLGQAGDWRVILDETPPAMEPLTPRAPSVSRRAVLAQSSRGVTRNRLPLLIYEEATYGDFKLTTRFKVVSGALDPMAGVAFRFQNESNFYFAGASSGDGYFRCSKVVDGELKPPIGPALAVARDAWHELSVQREGNRIVCALDGNEAIKLIDAAENRPGKIGFCTGADAVVYFADAKVTYTPRENLALKLVQEALAKYPRLLDLKICAVTASGKDPVVVASKDPQDLGRPAEPAEQDVLRHGTPAFARRKGSAAVTLPLCDRNGDPIAAVCVVLKTFPGQTEDNAFARARPVVRAMQARVQSREDLLQ